MTCILSNGLRSLRVRIAAIITWAAIAPQFIGCQANRYELEMTVEGDTLHRQLVCRRESTGDDPPQLRRMPDHELQMIASAYGIETPENSEREFEFSGDFQGRTPGDIGGSGTLTMFEADMGRTWIYSERFRGNDDVSATLAERQAASDELVDAITAWLKAEFDDDDFALIRDFIEGPLREDLRNIATYAWLGTAIDDGDPGNGSAAAIDVRLAQYAFERDYLEPADLPRLLQIINELNGDSLLDLTRLVLTNKLGPDAAAGDWRFLANPMALSHSINSGLQQHPAYEEFAAEWREQNPENDPAETPKPAEFVGDLAARSIGLNFNPADSLRVTLSCPVQPFRTNGDWSEELGAIIWEEQLTPHQSEASERVLPALLFAFWSVPDEAIQMRHFGRVVLQGEPLAEYLMWLKAIPDAEAAEWDAFIAELQPSATLRADIETFRFSSDPRVSEEGSASSSRYGRGRQLIVSGLDDET